MEIGSTIARVTATDSDKDDVIEYTIASQETDVFIIDQITGEIILQSALDRETKASHEIIIQASDSFFVAMATVNVTVTDVNDNAPVFQSASYRCVQEH